MAEILAVGTTAAQSSTVTLTSGQEATLSLFTSTGVLERPQRPDVFHVEKQASNSEWVRTGAVLTADQPVIVIRGIGSFRVNRPALNVTQQIGVDKD